MKPNVTHFATAIHHNKSIPWLDRMEEVYSLAYKEHIDCTEIKLIKIRQRSKTIIGGMLASVKLKRILSITAASSELSHELTITVLPLY